MPLVEPLPTLYAITHPGACASASHAELVRRLVAAGVRLVQIRDRALPDSGLFAEIVAAAPAARQAGALLIVNDRPDLALVGGADGVHLGETDFPVSAARRLLGESRLIGVSTHSREEALAASRDTADYVAIGPIYPSLTKKTDRVPLGAESVAWVRARTDAALVAIGGVTLERVAEIIQAGADSIAVISDLYRHEDLFEAVASFQAAIEAAR